MESKYVLFSVLFFLLMNFTSFAQRFNQQLNVGEKHKTVNFGTVLYSKNDGTGSVTTLVPGNSDIIILSNWQNEYYHAEYKHFRGYISDAAFVETDPITPSITERIKAYVESEINIWQKKGEFERTIDFQKRVTDQSRNIKVQQLTDLVLSKLKEEYRSKIFNNTFSLGIYDADNETFLIKANEFGNFAMNIPYDQAQSFKSNWRDMEFKNVDFLLVDDQFFIAKLDIYNPIAIQTFSYDSKIATTYSTSDFAYNFAPIEIDMQNHGNGNSTIIQNNTVIVGKSDIDIDIPINSKQNTNYFAVIIGNENYRNEIKVRYAINDAASVNDYFKKILGIPANNIHYIENATYGQMLSDIEWLNNVSKAFNGKSRIFYYYAGHGIPNEQTKSTYLLPTDGNSSITQTAIKIEDLYNKLTQYQTQSVTVFLDACFSGAAREGTLAEGRGVKIKPKDDILKGNIVVFSAASGDETAHPYNEKQHGLFTYFLLKKIKESNGDLTFGELSEFVKTNVNQQSIILNQKSQTPQTNMSIELKQEWKTIKVR